MRRQALTPGPSPAQRLRGACTPGKAATIGVVAPIFTSTQPFGSPPPRKYFGRGAGGEGFLPESRECPGENVLIRFFTPSVRDLGVASRAVAMTSPSPGAGTVHLWGVNTRSLDCARDDTRGWAAPYATRWQCHCKRLLAGLDPGGRVLPETDIDAPAGLSGRSGA